MKNLRFIIAVLAIALSVALLMGIGVIPRMIKSAPEAQEALTAAWQSGEAVVLIRHAERCDRSEATCLGPADGITIPGKEMSNRVGVFFEGLGLEKTDIYNSPMTRTSQTAHFLFGGQATNQQWLAECDAMSIQEVLAHKQKGRNLVVVTHNGCMNQVLKSLNLYVHGGPDYGSSLMVRYNEPSGQTQFLGYLKARDWGREI